MRLPFTYGGFQIMTPQAYLQNQGARDLFSAYDGLAASYYENPA